MRNKLTLLVIAFVVLVTLWSVDAQNQDIRRGSGSGGGQPASANLTNWSNVTTNEVVFTNTFREYTNSVSVFMRTNTFNTDQFTLLSGTNVNIKSGALITNATFTGGTYSGSFHVNDLAAEAHVVYVDNNGTVSYIGSGDLGQFIVGDGSGNFATVSPGANGLYLMSDSGSGNGYSWGSPALTSTNFAGIVVTNNIAVKLSAASPVDVVDMNFASATNVLAGALTIAHATNGAHGFEHTHVRWLWAGGADRALTIPSGWKTNVYSAVPASITNGTITKMYVTTVGDTGSSANQTNVFVSFEYYK